MFHPAFRQVLLTEHARQLERDLRRAHVSKARQDASRRTDVPVSLRLCTVHDDAALMRLAALEGRPLPTGSFVVAEIAGKLVAAAPLDGGLPLADPFFPTAQLMPLLHLRAQQIETGANRRSLLARSWSAVRSF